MDKDRLLEKIKQGNYDHNKLISWASSLPSNLSSRKPKYNKIGDIYMHPIFHHPYVLLKKQNNIWVCGLITSESKCPEILEECRSRFIEGYLTRTLFTASEILGSFINNYDNPRHLNKVLSKLRKILL